MKLGNRNRTDNLQPPEKGKGVRNRTQNRPTSETNGVRTKQIGLTSDQNVLYKNIKVKLLVSEERIMNRLMTICFAVILLLVTIPAQSMLLSELLVEGATITSGDKLFYGFVNYDSSASAKGESVAGVDPADIIVSAYQNPTNGEYGLKFQSSKIVITESPSALALSFDYLVRSTLPNYLISDNTLTMEGTISAGNVGVNESATNPETDSQLAYKYTLLQGMYYSKLFDHQTYTTPASVVYVSTSISLNKASGGPNQLTAFTQTFSQVPEPATMVLLGLGGLFLRKCR